jgi:hypothetical protein
VKTEHSAVRQSAVEVEAMRERSLDRALVHAHALGVAFLATQQAPDGRWTDFDTLAGPSDEWVTAFVAAALAHQPGVLARRCAAAAWRALRRRRWWAAGWGYSARVPCDADSTLWVLHLADRLGVKRSWRLGRARRLVATHASPDGGIATFRLAGPIRRFTGLPFQERFRGWRAAHVCVTAVAAGLKGLAVQAGALAYLRRAQLDDGSWSAYWWVDREYATALAVDALALCDDGDARPAIERGVSWAVSRLRGGQGVKAFPFACALRAALRGRTAADAVLHGLRGLVDGQLIDGSWPSSAALRIPPPHVIDPDTYQGWCVDGRGGGSIQVDRGRCFTTAVAVETLGRALGGRG